MLDVRLFRIPAFTGTQVAAFALSASIFAMFLYLTLYLQNILDYSPLQAGLRFLPISLPGIHLGADLRQAERAGADPSADGRRAGPRRRLPLADDRAHADLVVDRAPPGVHHRRAGHRASSILRSRRAPSRRCGASRPASGRGSTPPSARSGSRPGSRRSARSSSIRSPPIASGHPQLGAALPEASFVSGLNDILWVGFGIAAVGSVLAFVLVRGKDFIASAPEGAVSALGELLADDLADRGAVGAARRSAASRPPSPDPCRGCSSRPSRRSRRRRSARARPRRAEPA